MPSPRRRSPLAVFFGCAVLAAQQPDPSHVVGEAVAGQLLLEVTSRLRSEDPAVVAWGAWLAAEHRVAAAVPALRERLATFADVDPRERRFVVQALLDALACNAAPVTADEVAPFATGLHVALCNVLLSADPAANAAFFAAQYREHDGPKGRLTPWLAAGNLLASVRRPELVRAIVPTLDHRFELVVHDEASDTFRGAGAAMGGASGDGRVDVPKGYPPVALYELTLRPQRGDVVLAPGERTVHWRRSVRAERRFGVGSREPVGESGRAEQRVAWLAQVLDVTPVSLDIAPRERVWIEWQGADALRARARQLRERREAAHAAMLERCVRLGMLSAEQAAGLPAKVAFTVEDARGDRAAPLPELGG